MKKSSAVQNQQQEVPGSTFVPNMNSLVNVVILNGNTYGNILLRYEEINKDGKPEIKTGFLHNSQSGWIKSGFLQAKQVWAAKPDLKLEKGQWIFKLVHPISEDVFCRVVSTPENIYLSTSPDDWGVLNTNENCVFKLGSFGESMDENHRKILISKSNFLKFEENLKKLFINNAQYKKFRMREGIIFTDEQ